MHSAFPAPMALNSNTISFRVVCCMLTSNSCFLFSNTCNTNFEERIGKPHKKRNVMLKYVNINSCLPITTESLLYVYHGNINYGGTFLTEPVCIHRTLLSEPWFQGKALIGQIALAVRNMDQGMKPVYPCVRVSRRPRVLVYGVDN